MTLRAKLQRLRDALPPADPASPEALCARLQALAALEYATATPDGCLRIDAERVAAREAYDRDPEGYLAALREAIATHAAAPDAAEDSRP